MSKKIRAVIFALLAPLLYSIVQQVVGLVGRSVFMFQWAQSHNLSDTEATIEGYLAFVKDNGLVMLLVSALTCIALAYVFLGFMKNMEQYAIIMRPDILNITLLIVCGLAMFLLTSLLTSLIESAGLIPGQVLDDHKELSEMIQGKEKWLSILVAGLIVPIAEELLFRGVCFRALRGAFSIRAAIVLQALLFAGFHGNMLQVLYVFPVAIVLGLVYEWSGSLVAPILLHIAFNSANELVALLPKGETQEINTLYNVLFLSAVVAGIVTIKWLYKNRVENQSMTLSPTRPGRDDGAPKNY